MLEIPVWTSSPCMSALLPSGLLFVSLYPSLSFMHSSYLLFLKHQFDHFTTVLRNLIKCWGTYSLVGHQSSIVRFQPRARNLCMFCGGQIPPLLAVWPWDVVKGGEPAWMFLLIMLLVALWVPLMSNITASCTSVILRETPVLCSNCARFFFFFFSFKILFASFWYSS